MGLPAFLAAWSATMAAMMLPSEFPLFRLDHARRDPASGPCFSPCGAFRMGVENGLWCVGCCAGLTVALLALGMMSGTWMVVIAVMIFVEKATPIGVVASRAGAAALAVGTVAWTI